VSSTARRPGPHPAARRNASGHRAGLAYSIAYIRALLRRANEEGLRKGRSDRISRTAAALTVIAAAAQDRSMIPCLISKDIMPEYFVGLHWVVETA
jgi:hypothetical protein